MSEFKPGSKCPNCTIGTLHDDEGVLKCIQCGKSPATPKPPVATRKYNRGDLPYLLEHIDEIKEDMEKLGVREAREKWQIPYGMWLSKLRQRVYPEKYNLTPETGASVGSTTKAPVETSVGTHAKTIVPGTSEERRRFYESHKEDIIEDHRTMSAPDLKKKWGMSDKVWLRLRRIWGLPATPSILPAQLLTEISLALKYNTIEEARAHMKGFLRGSGREGWVTPEQTYHG